MFGLENRNDLTSFDNIMRQSGLLNQSLRSSKIFSMPQLDHQKGEEREKSLESSIILKKLGSEGNFSKAEKNKLSQVSEGKRASKLDKIWNFFKIKKKPKAQ